MKRWSNCWFEAMRMWLSTHLNAVAWVRRSVHYRGKIPHFGTAHAVGHKELCVVEYVPGNKIHGHRNHASFPLFAGRYRVWRFRATRVRSFKTHEEVSAYLHDNP